MKENNLTREQLLELDKKHYFHPTSSITEHQEKGASIIAKEGDGIYLKDFNGKTYIDGLSSLWNVNIGHGREELGRVASEQMAKLAFSSSFASLSHEPAIKLAAKLADITPGDLDVSFFTTGGSDGNETAYKLVRHYWKVKGQPNRNKIVARKLAYHGVNMGATSATGIPIFHQMCGPLASGFAHAAAPYCYNCEFDKEYPSCDLECALDIKNVIEKEGPETVAAVVAEPVQGAGGVIIPPDGYYQKVREICTEYGVIMIADEVITGFGRTGTMFGVEHSGVVPDMMVLAKGITSGYIPLGAVVITERLYQDFIKSSPPGVLAHGLTYSGHPTSCAVALANIEILENENLVENSRKMGEVLLEELKKIEAECPIVGEVRALGLVGAVELVKDKSTGEKFERSEYVCMQVYKAALDKGLVVRGIPIESDVMAMAPPLSINEEQVREMASILKEAILEVYHKLSEKSKQSAAV